MIFSLIKSPLDFAGFIIAILASIIVHAYAQAWMAARLGDFSAKYAGRMTLNPYHHFDPLGTLFLIFAGFGWSKPIPINVDALKHRYDRAKIALAGLLAQIALAALAAIPLSIALALGVQSDSNILLYFCSIVFQVSLWLTAIYLLPIPPLDGSVILQSIAPPSWDEALSQFEKYGPTILFGSILVEIFLNIPLLSPILFIITRLLEAFVMYPIAITIKYLVMIFI